MTSDISVEMKNIVSLQLNSSQCTVATESLTVFIVIEPVPFQYFSEKENRHQNKKFYCSLFRELERRHTYYRKIERCTRLKEKTAVSKVTIMYLRDSVRMSPKCDRSSASKPRALEGMQPSGASPTDSDEGRQGKHLWRNHRT